MLLQSNMHKSLHTQLNGPHESMCSKSALFRQEEEGACKILREICVVIYSVMIYEYWENDVNYDGEQSNEWIDIKSSYRLFEQLIIYVYRHIIMNHHHFSLSFACIFACTYREIAIIIVSNFEIVMKTIADIQQQQINRQNLL